MATKKPAAVAEVVQTKLFVLDTNVLLHDATCVFRFEEHDVFAPTVVIEELDHHKKGTAEVARNSRQFSRILDEIVPNRNGEISEGISLYEPSQGIASGRLFFETDPIEVNLPDSLVRDKADNYILAVVIHLQKKFPNRTVVLVSKDINMRIKARILGLRAQDYFNDKVLEDTDLLPTGMIEATPEFWEQFSHGDVVVSQNKGVDTYSLKGLACSLLHQNQFFIDEMGRKPLYGIVRQASESTAEIVTLTDYVNPRNKVWGINARNREQNFALNMLMDPEIDFVTLLGQAGTGKTLLPLAVALTQVLETKRYSEIIMTRVTVPVGEDIGFLPGTEEEKMGPWMGALEDNLEVLNKSDDDAGDWGRAATHDLIRNRIKIKSLNFMRGRTFLNKFLIIDEAQNLTPKQMKTLITRAGPGTKVVCLGNLAQIDTPYLTEGSSGLAYVVDRFKGWQHAGHITLQRGERSRLADYATEVL